MEGADVAELIRLLVVTGYLPPNTTGNRYTLVVTTAVKSFQRQNGLSVDGVAGPETILRLKSASSTSGADTNPKAEGDALGVADVPNQPSNSSSPVKDALPIVVALGLIGLYVYNKYRGDNDGYS